MDVVKEETTLAGEERREKKRMQRIDFEMDEGNSREEETI